MQQRNVRSRYQSRRSSGFIRVVWVMIILAVLGYGAHSLLRSGALDVAASSSKLTDVNLGNQLTAIFKDYPQVTVGVSVINLSSGKQNNFGSTQPITAASTTKLVTALDFLHQVEGGTYKLSGPLDNETAGWQLQQLINQSNDDSWQDFITLMGGQQIQDYAHQIGLNSFTFNGNTIAPSDDAKMLAALYQGKLLNASDTQLLLSYMQHTNDEQLIPAALPSSATVWHKYGELLEPTGNFVHDTAIIKNNGHTFVLSIYTDRPDMLDIQQREQLIHRITQAVVNYES
ncbi:MAG TPA: serine hydrolase [Candidatus Saccharimonadales bacterium]|nr:serine hydrolase [Candidatus Saccharimonadales bacterium]